MCDSPAPRSARTRLCPGAKSAIVARCRANGAQMSVGTARPPAQNSRKRMQGSASATRFAVAHFGVGESDFGTAPPSRASWPANADIMPLVEAAASAGYRKAMEGNGWSAMVPSQGSSQSTRKTLKILALEQPDSGWQRIKEESRLRCGMSSERPIPLVQLAHSPGTRSSGAKKPAYAISNEPCSLVRRLRAWDSTPRHPGRGHDGVA